MDSRTLLTEHNNLQTKAMTSSSSLSQRHNCMNGTYYSPIIITESNQVNNCEDIPVPTTISTIKIIRRIWVWIAVVFITFVVCLSVFPSIIALVDSAEKGNVSYRIYFNFNGILKSMNT